jgi:NAD+ synthetase|nr:MAG TPA: hypothetical protein [Caudoviricetes sp.]
MESKLDYKKVFDTLVQETSDYVTSHNLKAMVLGISGGIDSTVVAAICHEVSKQTGIPLIGRSLPIKNKEDEFSVSKLVGEAFCADFKVINLHDSYHAFLYNMLDETTYTGAVSTKVLEGVNGQTPIANGNIQARLRMMYLYNLASIHKGLVMSTDNQAEYQLGFWTIHGDVGDYDPIQDLWKTEVYKLAEYLFYKYDAEIRLGDGHYTPSDLSAKMSAIKASIALTPTDGLGISNSDLDQIGAKSYVEVDDILQTILSLPTDEKGWVDAIPVLDLYKKYSKEVVDKVWRRHLASEFKRKKAPIYIPRVKYAG